MGDSGGPDPSNERTEGPAAGEPAAGPPAAWGQPAPGQGPYGQAPYGQAPYGQAPYGQPPYGQYPYPPPPYGQYPYPPPPGYPPGQYPPPPGYPPQLPRNSGRAVAVLCCGIGSLPVLFTCFIGFVPAIVALCLAPAARREIVQSQGMITGAGMVQAGRICAWITIVLTVLGVAAVVALLSWGSGSWLDIGPFDINTY